MDDALRSRIEAWIEDDPDPASADELRALLASEDDVALRQRFDTELAFGTAGLRGALRAGPNGMNPAVVERAAAGLGAWLGGRGSVVIGYDARHRSAEFAHACAAVLGGAGLGARLLPRALPTPVLAFAVRHLGTDAGVMVTASHNPPGDNGLKVYLADGAQLVGPADAEIEAAIRAVGPLCELPHAPVPPPEGAELVEAYVAATAALSLVPDRDIRVVATAMHGVGRATLEAVFARAGLAAPEFEPSQAEPDPDFPTVAFPNPEEPGALDRVLALAERRGADLVVATDPDADRCAVAVAGRVLRGDELGLLLADHVLAHRPGPVATSLVSSSALGCLAAARGVPYAETLTGFKWIVRAHAELAFGYEEALGYAVAPDVVRDKDGISAALLICERAAELKARGATLLDRLDELALELGLHATDQLSVRVADVRRIADAMTRLRARLPEVLGGRAVEGAEDLLVTPRDGVRADVVVLRLAGDARVVVRPSGTEPKLKAYLEAVEAVDGVADLPRARAAAAATLAAVKADLPGVLGLDA